ncbi:MAG: rRNA pseudouridine synthase [Lachnospiraceae bacterium]|nr:rRNA pseudouridine synthase [Lachnospiraceae bacterium]
MRLDKMLSECGIGTRSEIKKYIKDGLVCVDGSVAKKPDIHIDEEKAVVTFKGQQVNFVKFEYFMLNKPQGYVTAVKDNVYPTVMELVTDNIRNDLSPVGRLDVDTEGLLLITNDGDLSHRLLSPKHHVPKTYYAEVNGIVDEATVQVFEAGLDIGDEKPTLPATLKIQDIDEVSALSKIYLTICEGRFHQVKRMFEAVGMKVVFLKRVSMGSLTLDEALELGKARRLSDEEIEELRGE